MSAQNEAKTVNAVAFERLQELIFSGEIELGARLDERQLSEQIGVSRTPLREAIGRLASLGVVEHRVYKGNFVRTFTAQQVRDLYEVRKALEGLAARAAATRASADEKQELARIVAEGTRAFEEGDMVGFEGADREFHRAIVGMAGNALLASELDRLGLHIQLVRHIANLEPNLAEHTLSDRREVLDAIERGDAAGAETALAKHIAVVESRVLDRIDAEANAELPG